MLELSIRLLIYYFKHGSVAPQASRNSYFNYATPYDWCWDESLRRDAERERLSDRHISTHVYPKLNGNYVQQFLDWLSQQLGWDYAILQIDKVSVHISCAINWPENIIPLVQPPHPPEFNPIKRMTAVS